MLRFFDLKAIPLVVAAVCSSGAAHAGPVCDQPANTWGIRLVANVTNIFRLSQDASYNSMGNTGNCLTASSVTASVPEATATSSANLATGVVGVTTSGARWSDSANTVSELRDLVRWNLAPGTVTNIGVNVTMSGTRTGDLAGGYLTHGLEARLGRGYIIYNVDGNNVVSTDPGAGWVSFQILASTPTTLSFHGVVAVSEAIPYSPLVNRINAKCDNGAACNFTATITIEVPAGVSYTSDSTAFLGGHPPFFSGEVPLSNGVYYLQLPNGTPFGYYSYLTDPRYIYHFDMGYEFVFDANDGKNGIYLYDFKSGGFFYTSPTFAFPYLYDFSLNAVLYYYPDSKNQGRYTTNPRYFFNFKTGQIITK